MTFGAFGGYPRSFGGEDSVAEAVLESLNAARGTAYDVTEESKVYAENYAAALEIEAAWGSAERLAYLWDPWRCPESILARWEAILVLGPAPTDSLETRRQRFADKWAAFNEPALSSVIETKLRAALGDAFVAVELISPSNAVVHVPDDTYPWGTVTPGAPWYSTVRRLLVRTAVPSGWREIEYYAAIARIAPMLDALLPADMTFDWYRPPSPGAPVAVSGGPSAGGWYLDEPNLGVLVFDA